VITEEMREQARREAEGGQHAGAEAEEE